MSEDFSIFVKIASHRVTPEVYLAQERISANGGQMDAETLRAMHPLEALLRSMLPWVNAGEEAAYEDGARPGAEGND